MSASDCLAVAGRSPELPYPLKEVECADGTVQRVYDIPDGDKAKVHLNVDAELKKEDLEAILRKLT